MTTQNKRWLRLTDAAAETGLPVKTMLAAVHRGHLHAVQLGVGRNSPFRVKREDLDAWLASRRAGRRAW